MSNRSRYTRKQEQRNKLDVEARSKLCTKRAPSSDEVSKLFESIGKNKVAEFALNKIYDMDLNGLHNTEFLECSQAVTLYDFAVIKRRDKIAIALLRAGANPITSPISCWDSNMPNYLVLEQILEPSFMAYIVWLTRTVVEKKLPEPVCCSICRDIGIDAISFSACGHLVCTACFWREAHKADVLQWWACDGSDGSQILPTILTPHMCCILCGQVDASSCSAVGELGVLSQSPENCKATSRRTFLQLPQEHSIDAVSSACKKFVFDRAMHLSDISRANPGHTQVQRNEELRKACIADDCRRIAALVEAGADVDGRDEYGMTPVLLAAWLGHARAVWLLRRAGADINVHLPPLNYTAYDIARTLGYSNVLTALCGEALQNAVAQPVITDSVEIHLGGEIIERNDSQGEALPSNYRKSYEFNTLESRHDGLSPLVTVLIPHQSHVDSSTWTDFGVKGAESGALCVDHCFAPAFLDSLLEVFHQLPVALEEKERCAARSYFCDVTNRYTETIQRVTRQAARALFSSSNPSNNIISSEDSFSPVVSPEMRFLHYQRDGSSLTAHVDLARTDIRSGRRGKQDSAPLRSTHTMILYLTDCAIGGETVLLRTLPVAGSSSSSYSSGAPKPKTAMGGELMDAEVARVSPRKGRLLLFPHNCPHEGSSITADCPKLLLRGEIYIPSSLNS